MGAVLITPLPPRVAGDSFSASSSVRRDAKRLFCLQHSVHSGKQDKSENRTVATS